MKRTLVLAALAGGLLGGVGCAREAKELSGAGSTFVQPMMQKWADLYKNDRSVKVNYQGGGSGAGVKQMTDKSVDFGCTDAFMTKEQLDAAEKAGGPVLHLPLVMGGVVPAYNLDGVDKPLKFTGAVLADIFLGNIKTWNDPKIQNLQEADVKLPAKEIATVHRADSSGTTSIFTDYLCKVSPDWKDKVGTGTTVKWPVGGGESGTSGVAGFVTKNPGSIGYVELFYALQNNIKFGAVQNKAGRYVTASLDSVTKAGDAALTSIPDDLRYSITNAEGEDSYPISGTTWAVIYQNQPAGKGKDMVDFLRWATHEGQAYTKDLQYASLPSGLADKVTKKLDSVKVGQ